MQAPTLDTLLLSDIHLGSEISRARDALALLRSCSFRRLILVGDIFSDLNFARLSGDHWKFLSYIRKLSNFKRYVWTYDGLRHLAIHGHQFDRFALDNELLSRAGELLFSRIQKIDMRNK